MWKDGRTWKLKRKSFVETKTDGVVWLLTLKFKRERERERERERSRYKKVFSELCTSVFLLQTCKYLPAAVNTSLDLGKATLTLCERPALPRCQQIRYLFTLPPPED